MRGVVNQWHKLTNMFWNSRLKTKLILLYIPVAVCCVTLVCYCTYRMASQVLVSHVMEEATLKGQTILSNIETELLEIRRKEYALIGRTEGFATVSELFDAVRTQFSGLGGIKNAFYQFDGNCIYGSTSAFEEACDINKVEVQTFLASNEISGFLDPIAIEGNQYIAHIRRTEPWDMGVGVGYMVTYIDLPRFRDILGQYGSGIVFLMDDKGQILEVSDQTIDKDELLYSVQRLNENRYGKSMNFRAERYYVNVQSESRYGWKVVFMVSAKDVNGKLLPLVGMIALMMVGYFLLTILLFVIVSGVVVNPLQKITCELREEAQKPYRFLRFHSRYQDEIGQLADAFGKKEEQIEEYIEEISNLETMRRKMEVAAFAAQMNPHLLYNTLATIIWLINQDKRNDAILATKSLATLLQDSLRQTEDCVPVWRELEALRNYIGIQQLRYSDKFKYIIYVDDDTLQYLIPRVVLQPLFENAIYHGIKLRDSIGLIRVTGHMEGEDVVIQIADNGPADAEKIGEINRALQKQEMSDFRIGIRNVHMRLQHRYGNNYGLSFEKKGEFTVVTVRFPAERREEGEGNV